MIFCELVEERKREESGEAEDISIESPLRQSLS